MANWSSPWSMNLTEINAPGDSIMLMEFHKASNDLSTGNNSYANNRDNIAAINATEYWPHAFHKSNYGLVDGSARFLSLQTTYKGLKDATANDNQINTMWDCQD